MTSNAPPEFSHAIPLSEIGSKPTNVKLHANDAERQALAKRFDLLSLEMLAANVALRHETSGIMAEGDFTATLTQPCVASGVPVAVELAESIAVRFIPEPDLAPDFEIELEIDDCDTVFHNGRVIDLGELVAQSLALAIDPFPRSPNAEAILKKAGVKGEHEAGPFAALAALRDRQG